MLVQAYSQEVEVGLDQGKPFAAFAREQQLFSQRQCSASCLCSESSDFSERKQTCATEARSRTQLFVNECVFSHISASNSCSYEQRGDFIESQKKVCVSEEKQEEEEFLLAWHLFLLYRKEGLTVVQWLGHQSHGEGVTGSACAHEFSRFPPLTI